jgi:hypothetical protein
MVIGMRETHSIAFIAIRIPAPAKDAGRCGVVAFRHFHVSGFMALR